MNTHQNSHPTLKQIYKGVNYNDLSVEPFQHLKIG